MTARPCANVSKAPGQLVAVSQFILVPVREPGGGSHCSFPLQLRCAADWPGPSFATRLTAVSAPRWASRDGSGMLEALPGIKAPTIALSTSHRSRSVVLRHWRPDPARMAADGQPAGQPDLAEREPCCAAVAAVELLAVPRRVLTSRARCAATPALAFCAVVYRRLEGSEAMRQAQGVLQAAAVDELRGVVSPWQPCRTPEPLPRAPSPQAFATCASGCGLLSLQRPQMPEPPPENVLIHALIDEYLEYNRLNACRSLLETGECSCAPIKPCASHQSPSRWSRAPFCVPRPQSMRGAPCRSERRLRPLLPGGAPRPLNACCADRVARRDGLAGRSRPRATSRGARARPR